MPSTGLVKTTVSKKHHFDLTFIEGEEEKEVRCMTTGDRFTMTTTDPERMPLPSVELLDLQFYLQRIASMSAAGGINKLDFEDDREEQMAKSTCGTPRVMPRYIVWLASTSCSSVTDELF